MSRGSGGKVSNSAGGVLRWLRAVRHDVETLPTGAVVVALGLGIRASHLVIPGDSLARCVARSATELGQPPAKIRDHVLALVQRGWLDVDPKSGDLTLSVPPGWKWPTDD